MADVPDIQSISTVNLRVVTAVENGTQRFALKNKDGIRSFKFSRAAQIGIFEECVESLGIIDVSGRCHCFSVRF
jgi:hypothetical protein